MKVFSTNSRQEGSPISIISCKDVDAMTSADQIFKGSNKQMSGDFCRKKSRFLFLLLRIQNSIMTSSYMAIITILILITANSVQVQGYGYTEQKFAMEPQDQVRDWFINTYIEYSILNYLGLNSKHVS